LLSITSTRSVANVRAKTLNTLVETLFERLSVSLSTLINSVESAIPLAEKTPLWKHLLDAVGADGVGTFKSRQLKRDLGLTEVTIGNLKAIRRNLEEARAFLRGYSDNIAYYKVSCKLFAPIFSDAFQSLINNVIFDRLGSRHSIYRAINSSLNTKSRRSN
jgi:hypothetical protein